MRLHVFGIDYKYTCHRPRVNQTLSAFCMSWVNDHNDVGKHKFWTGQFFAKLSLNIENEAISIKVLCKQTEKCNVWTPDIF